MSIKLPTGDALTKELSDRNISTAGLARNMNGAPMETAMQEVLLQVLRDERDERAVSSAEALTGLTGKLVTATWAVAIASGALILVSIAQIVVMLGKK
jgi:uncharacterized protein YfaQ (DUF2300 family)